MEVFKITVGNEGNLLAILYIDGTLAVFDFQKAGSYFSIISHFSKINDILWTNELVESA